MNQSTLTNEVLGSYPLVLCLTPPGLYGLMKKIGDKEPPWGESYFDLLVVDEASMMRLPELILSGSFLCKNSQILVAGDHRQLPPIVAHNWEKEDRRTLEEMASFSVGYGFSAAVTQRRPRHRTHQMPKPRRHPRGAAYAKATGATVSLRSSFGNGCMRKTRSISTPDQKGTLPPAEACYGWFRRGFGAGKRVCVGCA